GCEDQLNAFPTLVKPCGRRASPHLRPVSDGDSAPSRRPVDSAERGEDASSLSQPRPLRFPPAILPDAPFPTLPQSAEGADQGGARWRRHLSELDEDSTFGDQLAYSVSSLA